MYSFELLSVMRGRIATISITMCLLFVLSSYSLTIPNNNDFEDSKAQSTLGRSIHYGDWVAHREIPVEDGCEGSYYGPSNLLIDSSSEGFIAVYSRGCGSVTHDIRIFNAEDLSLMTTLQNDKELSVLDFSPNGEFLVAASSDNVRLFQSSDWQSLLDEDMDTWLISDTTWSGDSNRLVVSTGNNGGHMYEGPDWNEVDGTTSNGQLVAHHPSEDILWYIGGDGAGNVYEYQSVPLAGYQWVMTRSFTASYGNSMISAPDGDSLLIFDGYYTKVYSTSDYTMEEEMSATDPSFSFDASTVLLSSYSYTYIVSAEDWTLKSSFGDYYGHVSAFSANDSEIFTLSYADTTTQITGYMPDTDKDGVVDYRDQCPNTSSSENSNSAGCAPSQRDSDSDGINDRDDFCPRTQIASAVNSQGCSEAQLADTDNDGVPDSDDECPSTPLGAISDRRGCSSHQRDLDNDGILDVLDDCPLHSHNDCPRVVFWDTSTSEIGNTSNYSQIEFSPDGQYIAAFDRSSGIDILNQNFQFQYEIQGNTYDHVFDAEWSPSGTELLIFWHDYWLWNSVCEYQVWNISTQSLSERLSLYDGCTEVKQGTTRFSPDGATFATIGFSSQNYRTTTIIKDFSNHTTLLEDDDFSIEHLEFSHDGSSLFGGDGSQFVMWDMVEYEFIKSSRAEGTDHFYLTPDGNYILTSDNENLEFYRISDLELTATRKITQNESQITDITFSRSGDLMYTTVMVGYCSSGCEHGVGRLTELHSYDIEGDELVLLRTSDIINTSDMISPTYHPLEYSAYVKPGYFSNYTIWRPDSDGDGFIDIIDECPGTNLDVEVDDRGCGGDQLDDDGDGLANFEDVCPDSPNGINTDEKGCTDQQVDADLDGICNKDAPGNGPSDCVGEDKCPNTANGIIIDSNGCSWAQQDSDGDGVNNVEDQCEDTEIPGDADLNGCDRKQRDTDGDSVNDYGDKCSFTPNGESIDDAGCSDSQVDSDSDSVCDRDAQSIGPSGCEGIDQCPNTGINGTVNSNGCSWNQQDDDNDGVFNKFDQCPETTGDSVGADGCTISERDTDNDGILDTNDECPGTQKDAITNQVGCSDSQGQGSLSSDEDESSMIKWSIITGIILVVLLVGGFLFRRDGLDNLVQETPIKYPEYATRGVMKEGREWIEYPQGSGNSFYRNPSTGQWVKND